MYDTAVIRAQIASILTALVDVSSHAIFANVYDYPNPNPAGYPCAIMDVVSDDGQFLDNITNLHALTFHIWLVQEVTVVGQDTAVAKLDSTSKYVIQALEKLSNASLSGNVSWLSPTTGGRRQTQTPNGPVFYKEIILKCNVTSTIN